MKLIPSFGEISSKTKEAFKRFPIVLSWAIVGTLFALLTTESNSFNTHFYAKVIGTFILGISWLIATRFLEEQFKSDKEWLMLLPIGFLFLFYWHLPTDEKDLGYIYSTRFILYFIAGHLFIFVAPFLLKWNKSAYFNYIKSVFIAIVRSLLFSLILYLGIVLALLAVKHLFNIDFDGRRFFQIFIICLGVVNTWIYVSDFPKNIHTHTTVNYTKALEVLVKYILIPLVILYLIILYAYSLKIVINWSLPKGWVSYLVIALSFLGFIIQMLINPIQKTIDSRPIKRFYPWFYYLLLPLLGLLFIAIFRRVNEYGITENRYYVLVIALWILAMTLYMLFSKRKKIKVFPFTLGVLALFVSVGFWGAFSVSTKSQVKQFEKVYKSIKEKDFKITHKENNQFRSIIRYLADKNELAKTASTLGYNPINEFTKENKWNISNKIIDSLGIKITNTEGLTDILYGNSKYFNLNTNNQIFEIKGYDYFKQIWFNSTIRTKENEIRNLKFFLNKKVNTITISDDKNIEVLNLDKLINSLLNRSSNANIENIKEMTLEESFEGFNLKIIFTNINFTKKETAPGYRIQNANGYVFIKEKNATQN